MKVHVHREDVQKGGSRLGFAFISESVIIQIVWNRWQQSEPSAWIIILLCTIIMYD